MATLSPTFTIPDVLIPRIMAALRARHPDITTGLLDGPAFKACVRYLISQELAAYEGSRAGSDAMTAAQTAASTANTTALTDAQQIT